jgi:hypothetical protein
MLSFCKYEYDPKFKLKTCEEKSVIKGGFTVCNGESCNILAAAVFDV